MRWFLTIRFCSLYKKLLYGWIMTENNFGVECLCCGKSGNVNTYEKRHSNFSNITGDEIDLKDLFRTVYEYRYFILVVTSFFVVIALVYALYLPNKYRSESLLSLSGGEGNSSMSKVASQLGGLASLAGINVGGSEDSKLNLAIATLKSRKFIAGFIDRHHLLPDLMAVKKWDEASNSVIYDENLYDIESKIWVRSVQPPKKAKPSDWDAYEFFIELFSLAKDKETGYVTVAVEHWSPYVAKRWVELLIKDVNDVIKNKDIIQAQKSISFLKKELSKVSLADMKVVFYQLIEEQMQIIMLANTYDEYVFTVIDPPVVAEEKASPKRLVYIFVGFFVGLFLSLFLVIIKKSCSS